VVVAAWNRGAWINFYTISFSQTWTRLSCCGGNHSSPWKRNCICWLVFNNSASPSKTVEDIYLLGALRGYGQHCAPLTLPAASLYPTVSYGLAGERSCTVCHACQEFTRQWMIFYCFVLAHEHQYYILHQESL